MLTPGQVRAIALELPQAREVETWGHPTFRVQGAIFASTSADGLVAIVKASKAAQAALLASDPETYSKADYFGRFGWIRVRLSRADPQETRELIAEGWRSAAPKRLVALFDGGGVP